MNSYLHQLNPGSNHAATVEKCTIYQPTLFRLNIQGKKFTCLYQRSVIGHNVKIVTLPWLLLELL